MKKLLSLLFIGTLCGCASTGYYQTTQTSALSPEQAHTITQDIVAQLSDQFAPAHTVFSISNTSDIFGATLEKDLRQHGYAVTSTPSDNHTRMGFIVEPITPEEIRVRVVAGDQWQFHRMYHINEKETVPVSAINIRHEVLS